ncbi:MAG: YciI family protein [Alphaproteobacteria bacterium]
MWFLFRNYYSAEAEARRPAQQQAHLDFLRDNQHRMVTAGPMFDEWGKERVGSIYIVDLPDRETARAWVAEEPFTKHGVYGRYDLHVYEHRWPRKEG